jgi:hypothetical protein
MDFLAYAIEGLTSRIGDSNKKQPGEKGKN